MFDGRPCGGYLGFSLFCSLFGRGDSDFVDLDRVVWILRCVCVSGRVFVMFLGEG